MAQASAAKTASIIFKFVLAGVAAGGIILSVVLARNAGEAANTFFYFTTQSNLIVCAVMLWGAARLLARRPEGRAGVVIRNGALLWILITGLVFNFMLGGPFRFSGAAAWASFLLHYLSPALVVADWLLFEEKGGSRYVDALIWMIYPVAYVVVAEIRLALDGFAPYWFLDPTRKWPQGMGSVWVMLAMVAGLVAFFALFGLLIIRIDRIWRKKGEADWTEEKSR